MPAAPSVIALVVETGYAFFYLSSKSSNLILSDSGY